MGNITVAATGGATGSITTTHGGGTPPYTFVWSNGQETSDATNLYAGDHSVTIIDACGATASASVTIGQTDGILSAVCILCVINVLIFISFRNSNVPSYHQRTLLW